MGLFDSLFGGDQKAKPNKKEPFAAAVTGADKNESAEIKPEIVAAIIASLSCVMDANSSMSCSSSQVHAAKAEYSGSIWAITGRQKMMDARQFS